MFNSHWSLSKIATLIGAHILGESNRNIDWLLTDSRSLCFPESTLFFALKTQKGDGHKYIADLYQRGVRAFVVERHSSISSTTSWQQAAEDFPEAGFLVVKSSLEALQRLAERHRDEFDIPIIGVTGSNGKTWVKEWLFQILRSTWKTNSGDTGVITRSPRSYNSQIGVPLSVILLNSRSKLGIFEAGISQTGEMEILHDIIQPTIGILTSLGNAHQEHFRSKEEKCMEKMKLFAGAETIVYPHDDDIVSRCMRKSGFTGKRLGWSRKDENAAFYVSRIVRHAGPDSQKGEYTSVCYTYNGHQGQYEIPFTSEASVDNSITCAATALLLGITTEQLAEQMLRLEPIAMRLEVKQGQRGLTIINDSYNSDINSLNIALDFMSRREGNSNSTGNDTAGTPRHASVLVLSDISQSGETPEALYREVASLCEERKVSQFVGIGPELMRCQHLITTAEKHFFNDVDELLESRLLQQMSDATILLKGARRFEFERISEALEQKVHETILEVDLNTLVDNLNKYRSMMSQGTKLVCMIKADAYGAGAIEIARTLQEQRVDYLAVAVADEGVALRNAGITASIIVMNPEMSALNTLFNYELEPEVYSFRLLDALVTAARKEGITNFPVHIKLDTGMKRLGFDATDDAQIDELIVHLRQQALIPRSVFSHFVGADSASFNDFSAMQFNRFIHASDKLQQAFPHKILRHICNSAGIESFPGRHLDMCRLGIGLYTDVSSLKTTILQIRNVAAGESIGYGRHTFLERDSRIAAIPIGYADGLNRHLGNRKGYCIVNGKKADYVGNICMDIAMIDVTDIDCSEGDSVEIFGKQLPVEAISSRLDTITYEILTGVSNRVKRIYFKD